MGGQKITAPPARHAPLRRVSHKAAPAPRRTEPQRLIQTLRVGAVNDPAEREAEAMADRVVKGGVAPAVAAPAAAPPNLPRSAQDQPNTDSLVEPPVPEGQADFALPPANDVPTETLDSAGLDEITTGAPVELETDLPALPLRPAVAVGREGGAAPADVAARVASPGAGRPLPATLRARVEPAFGQDFGHVRLHDGPPDRLAAARIGARAFAHGQDIWLGPGERADDLPLMAHELTHVVQQTAGSQALPLHRAPIRRAGILAEEAEDIARHVPGYTLITVLVGQRLIAGDAVQMTGTNLLGGLFGLVPGGTAIFDRLNETRALEDAFLWVQSRLADLNIGWSRIEAILDKVLDAVASFSPIENLKKLFKPLVDDILTFVSDITQKVLEFILRGALKLAGPYADQVWQVIQNARDTLGLILDDPLSFAKNLVAAVVGGFRQFGANVVDHLKKGVLGWLFGALAGAGIEMPERLDFRGLMSILLQIVGLTYASFRAMLVRRLGPKGERMVAFIETSVEVVKTLVKEGFLGIWQKMLELIEGFRSTLIGGIGEMVTVAIVKAGIGWLAGLSNPVGAVVKVVLAIYDLVVTFIERVQQIWDVAQSIFSSIGAIARGQTKQAADFVEQTIGRTIPVVLAFLAALIGLNGIPSRIKAVFQKLAAPVKTAMKKLVDFVAKKAKALFSKVIGKVNKARKLPGYRFKVGEVEHSVFAQPKGKRTEVLIASDNPVPPGTVAKVSGAEVANIATPTSQTQAGELVAAVQQTAGDVKPVEAMDSTREDKPNAAPAKAGAEILKAEAAQLGDQGDDLIGLTSVEAIREGPPGLLFRARDPRLKGFEGTAAQQYKDLKDLGQKAMDAREKGVAISDFYEFDHTIEQQYPKHIIENLEVMKQAPADPRKQTDILRAGDARKQRNTDAGRAQDAAGRPDGSTQGFGLLGSGDHAAIDANATRFPAIALYKGNHILQKGKGLPNPVALIAEARRAHAGDFRAVFRALRKGIYKQLQAEIAEITAVMAKDPQGKDFQSDVADGLAKVKTFNEELYALNQKDDPGAAKAPDPGSLTAGQGSDFPFGADGAPDYAKVEGVGQPYGSLPSGMGRYFEYDHIVDKAYPARVQGLTVVDQAKADRLSTRVRDIRRQTEPDAKAPSVEQAGRIRSLKAMPLFKDLGLAGYTEENGYAIPLFEPLAKRVTSLTAGPESASQMLGRRWDKALPLLADYAADGAKPQLDAGLAELRAGVREAFDERTTKHLNAARSVYQENAAAVIALNGPDQVNQQRARDLMKTILGNLEKSASTSEAQTETLFR